MNLASPALLLLLAPALAGCGGLGNLQGPLQPQSVAGPCTVGRFFLLPLRSPPATMTVANTGVACAFALVNPALNVVIDAALLTGPARHGTARATLISGNRQALVSYTPAPGYAGPDRFDVTLEPNATGVTVHVTVTP